MHRELSHLSFSARLVSQRQSAAFSPMAVSAFCDGQVCRTQSRQPGASAPRRLENRQQTGRGRQAGGVGVFQGPLSSGPRGISWNPGGCSGLPTDGPPRAPAMVQIGMARKLTAIHRYLFAEVGRKRLPRTLSRLTWQSVIGSIHRVWPQVGEAGGGDAGQQGEDTKRASSNRHGRSSRARPLGFPKPTKGAALSAAISFRLHA